MEYIPHAPDFSGLESRDDELKRAKEEDKEGMINARARERARIKVGEVGKGELKVKKVDEKKEEKLELAQEESATWGEGEEEMYAESELNWGTDKVSCLAKSGFANR